MAHGAGGARVTAFGILAIATTKPELASRQTAYAVVGLLAGAIAAWPDYRRLRRYTPLLAAGCLFLLVFVLVPAVPEWLVRPRNGARRWINLGFTDLQPSELAKVVYVLAAAAWLRIDGEHRRLLGFAKPFLLTLVPVALILLEPDLGTSLLFMPTLFALLWTSSTASGTLRPWCSRRSSRCRRRIRCSSRTRRPASMRCSPRSRAIAATSRTSDTSRRGRWISSRGRRRGAWQGGGDAHPAQPPARVAQRHGLRGDRLPVGALGRGRHHGPAWRGGDRGAAAPRAVSRDAYGRLLAVGIATMLAGQAVVNIAMTIGLAPVTGMTLPFVSFGGSSLVTTWAMVGLVVNVALRRPPSLAPRRIFEFPAEEER